MNYYYFSPLFLPLLQFLLFTACKSMDERDREFYYSSDYASQNLSLPTHEGFRGVVQAFTASESDPVRHGLATEMIRNDGFRELPPQQQWNMLELTRNGPKPELFKSNQSSNPFHSSTSAAGGGGFGSTYLRGKSTSNAFGSTPSAAVGQSQTFTSSSTGGSNSRNPFKVPKSIIVPRGTSSSTVFAPSQQFQSSIPFSSRTSSKAFGGSNSASNAFATSQSSTWFGGEDPEKGTLESMFKQKSNPAAGDDNSRSQACETRWD